MNPQNVINYQRIATAIAYIRENSTKQPTLDEVAAKVSLSSYHFQRLFTDWAGVSPKKFLQYITVEHAKYLLNHTSATLFDTAYQTGLSGTGRLHDLFVNIEGMTPGEYKNKGGDLQINYSYENTLFGEVLVASTAKGICFMGFSDDRNMAFADLKKRYPHAAFYEKTDPIQQVALQIQTRDHNKVNPIKLHLKGTAFQLKVWEALLKIPEGNLTTYGQIARQIDKPGASRAVGTAIGSNPIAFFIPCHRVIQSSGIIGGYMWGPTRKAAIIGWEAAQSTQNK
jgi:AraC family transcriptional regulator of adaptative response/methylated-DNA-[protein]-cysteine methyltransferase